MIVAKRREFSSDALFSGSHQDLVSNHHPVNMDDVSKKELLRGFGGTFLTVTILYLTIVRLGRYTTLLSVFDQTFFEDNQRQCSCIGRLVAFMFINQ